MNHPVVRLQRASPHDREAFLEFAADYRDSGEDRYAAALADPDAYLRWLADMERAETCPPGLVTQTTFWAMDDEDRVLASSRLRHGLSPALRREGGHIGYDVRPSARRRGLGTRLLSLTLEEARRIGLPRVLLTCDDDNVASGRIILANGGLEIDPVRLRPNRQGGSSLLDRGVMNDIWPVGRYHRSVCDDTGSRIVPTEADYRLPRTVTPIHYELTLEPDLEAASFAGSMRVDVDVHEAVDEIVINAAELQIDRVELSGVAGETLLATASYDETTERVTLTFDGRAGPGAWQLRAEFGGVLNDELRGFYRAVYS